MKDWDPSLYSRFEKQRTQAAKDLINALDLKKVKSILDVGCGPGNSTQQLVQKWGDADIIGIDTSPNMLEHAKKRLPNYQFEIADANKDLSRFGKFDLIFSNAVIQWMPNHEQLISKLFFMLNDNGALAVQLPDVRNMGIQIAIEKTIKDAKWAHKLAKLSPFNMNDAGYYYDICSSLCNDFLLWETKYYHVMDSYERILDWYGSAGLRPYFDALGDDQDIAEFENQVLRRIGKHYQVQQDGNVLFPFERLFFILHKK